jgi:hypothetical protein
MREYSGFDAFRQEALTAEEMPATVGGIEDSDDLQIPEDSSEESGEA